MSEPSTQTPPPAASKPKRRTHLERTELSDSRMFEAAEELILEVGTQKTTLKEVGERAGYSRGLANARYGNKETLFLKLSERCLGMWRDELQRRAGSKRGLQALITRMDAIVSYALHHSEDARVMYILWFESVGSSSEMKQGLARFHQQARDDIQNLVEEAMGAGEIAQDNNAQLFAMHFTSTMFGLSYQWSVNPQAMNIEQQVSGIKHQLMLVLRPTS